MGWSATQEASWAQLLRRQRQRRFVGRRREIADFEEFLGDPQRRLLHIHGPGGIGKSALLECFESTAQGRGLRTEHVAARDLGTRPTSIARRIAETTSVDVWFIDGLEYWNVLDGWLRRELLPSLEASVRVVTAGREPLSAEWLTDPGWAHISGELRLTGLSTEEALELLRAWDVTPANTKRALAVARGSPLLLMLAAGGKGQASLGGDPASLVRRVVARVVRDAPTAEHQDALFLSVLAPWVDERLLQAVLQPKASIELVEWLGNEPGFISGAGGVTPHDRVRAALKELMESRAPERARELGRRVQHSQVERIASDRGAGELAMHQLVPAFQFEPHAEPFGFGTHIDAYPAALVESDVEPILQAVQHFEGDGSMRVVRRWLRRYPSAFVIARSREGAARGFSFSPLCDELHPEDASDPAFECLFAWLATWLPTGHRGVVAMRTWMTLNHYMTSCPEQGCLAAAH
ncbi:MAG: hypothetical protein R3B89_28285 [Polyangiaceae bacterium]